MLSNEALKIKSFLCSTKPTATAKISLEQKQQNYNSTMIKFSRVPEGIEIQKTMIGGINAEWISPPNAVIEDKVLLYIHGGSFYAGSLDTHRGFASNLSEVGGVKVLFFEYRLAPEYKFPAAFDDTLLVYRNLLNSGFQAENIIIGGESCGALLALMVLNALKENKEPLPAGAILLSLFGDSVYFDGESYITNADKDPISSLEASKEDAKFIWMPKIHYRIGYAPSDKI